MSHAVHILKFEFQADTYVSKHVEMHPNIFDLKYRKTCQIPIMILRV